MKKLAHSHSNPSVSTASISFSFFSVVANCFLIILIFTTSSITIIKATSVDIDEIDSGTLNPGRSYFVPNRPLSKRFKHLNENNEFVIEKSGNKHTSTESTPYVSKESESETNYFSDDYNNNELPSITSKQLQLSKYSTESETEPFFSSTPHLPLNSNSYTPRVDFQRPWCPGKLLSTLIPRAMDPIYDWKNPLTCQQFADNYGGISVVVGELEGAVFCSYGPNSQTSPYTIVRSLSINQPIYARLNISGQEFVATAGPILYPDGLVYYISITKEVNKLPQVCK